MAAEPYPVPLLRFVDGSQKPPALSSSTPLRLLTDADFPPFSFGGGDGAMAGLSADLAREACREINTSCEIIPRPWGELTGALEKGEGDAIVAGPKLDPAIARRFLTTRPYFRAMARFAVRSETPLQAADIRVLAGKRVATVKASAHADWLKRHFPQSAIIEFDTSLAAYEALRTGGVDAVFDDAFRLIFWKNGSASRGCCKLLPGAFLEEETISPVLGIIVRADREDLRQAFDYGLDRAQTSGAFAGIFRRYVPESPW